MFSVTEGCRQHLNASIENSSERENTLLKLFSVRERKGNQTCDANISVPSLVLESGHTLFKKYMMTVMLIAILVPLKPQKGKQLMRWCYQEPSIIVCAVRYQAQALAFIFLIIQRISCAHQCGVAASLFDHSHQEAILSQPLYDCERRVANEGVHYTARLIHR
jgi:hypothetical protein